MLTVVQEQAVAESKASKVNVKDESPVEVEARLRAQMAAARENGADEATMQVDSEVGKERIRRILYSIAKEDGKALVTCPSTVD